MNNAEKFKQLFGIYATELWAMPEVDFLKWLNEKVQLIQEDTTSDPIDRQAAIEAIKTWGLVAGLSEGQAIEILADKEKLPSAQPEIIRCKDCKHWRQQTTYQGAPLSFGFCESDDMWRSLYGETYEVSHIDTDDDFYCGYAERRTDGSD